MALAPLPRPTVTPQLLTAETQSTPSAQGFPANLCVLCASAVKDPCS